MAVRPRAGRGRLTDNANPLLLIWRVQAAPSTYTGVGAREGVEFTGSAVEMPRQPLLVPNCFPQLGPRAQKSPWRGKPVLLRSRRHSGTLWCAERALCGMKIPYYISSVDALRCTSRDGPCEGGGGGGEDERPHYGV